MNFNAPELGQIPMSTELAATLAHATDAAGQMGFPEVNLEHLLAALCDDPEALAILDSSGVDAARIRADAVAFLSRSAGPPVADRSSLFLSDEVKRILEAATAAARGGRRRDINGAILLAAIVGDGRSLAAQMLQSHGLSFESAIKALQSSLGQPTRERSMDRPMLADEVLARARERVQSRSAPSLKQIMSEMPRPSPPPPMPEPLAGLQSVDPLPDPAPILEDVSLNPSELLETLKAETSEPPAATVDEAIADFDAVKDAVPAASVDDATSSTEAPNAPDEPAQDAVPVDVAATEPQPADVPMPAPPSAPATEVSASEVTAAPPAAASPVAAPARPLEKPLDKMGAVPTAPDAAKPRAPAPDGLPANLSSTPQPNTAKPPNPFPAMGIERPRPGPVLPPPIPPNALPPGMPPLNARIGTGPTPAPHPAAPFQPAPPPGLGGPLQTGPRLPPQGAPPGGRPPAHGLQIPHGSQIPPGPQPVGPQHQLQPQGQSHGQSHGQSQAPGPGKTPPAGPASPARERAGKGDGSPLVENIPRTMRADTTERIEIRIARAAMKALGSGIESPQSGRRYGVGTVQAVAVRLKAPEGGFFIETASPESQWMDGQTGLSIDEVASWRFNVTPQAKGRGRLQIMTTARIVGSDGIAAETPMPDQIIEVKVRRNAKRALARWFGWLVAAAVGVAIALNYERGLESVRPLVERLTN